MALSVGAVERLAAALPHLQRLSLSCAPGPSSSAGQTHREGLSRLAQLLRGDRLVLH